MNKEQRMYCVSLRHLSGIQKGIQSAHAIVEYSNLYDKNTDYKQWATKDKTLILLEANTSEQLNTLYSELNNIKCNVSFFNEPDMNGLITAIAFLLDDRVWNSEKYIIAYKRTQKLRELISPFRLASN